ncbi:predicted protein, partial [Arabidopsis lyrata subsp. lyrata]
TLLAFIDNTTTKVHTFLSSVQFSSRFYSNRQKNLIFFWTSILFYDFVRPRT